MSAVQQIDPHLTRRLKEYREAQKSGNATAREYSAILRADQIRISFVAERQVDFEKKALKQN